MKKILKKIFLVIFILVIIFIIYTLCKTPSLNRNWTVDQQILPEINFLENEVEIKNMRDFSYETTEKYFPKYYSKKYNLEDLETVYYIVEPFSAYDWPAHTMLSFGFKTWEYVTVSAEIRKEVWESFWVWNSMINNYELVYMIWAETDFVKVRANYRKDEVFMYPIKIEKEDLKKFFLSVLKRADKLSKNPEFYNLFLNNCTTSILGHANEIRNVPIKYSWQAFLPAFSDKVIYDLWIIDTKMTFEEAKKYYKINELSEKYADSPDYSEKIRKERK